MRKETRRQTDRKQSADNVGLELTERRGLAEVLSYREILISLHPRRMRNLQIFQNLQTLQHQFALDKTSVSPPLLSWPGPLPAAGLCDPGPIS